MNKEIYGIGVSASDSFGFGIHSSLGGGTGGGTASLSRDVTNMMANAATATVGGMVGMVGMASGARGDEGLSVQGSSMKLQWYESRMTSS